MTPRLLASPPTHLFDGLPQLRDAARSEHADLAPGDRDQPWLALAPGEARLLTTVDASPTARDALVGWLAGRRGPWRRSALRLDGRALGHRRTAARVRAGLISIEPPVLAPEVSVSDHLAAVASPRRVARLLAEVPKLAGRGQDPAGVLSGGERQMVAWARSALTVPRVAVLDRAATGLDPEALAWVTDVLGGWRAAGCVVLVCAGRDEEATWPARTRPDGRGPGPPG